MPRVDPLGRQLSAAQSSFANHESLMEFSRDFENKFSNGLVCVVFADINHLRNRWLKFTLIERLYDND